MTEPQRTSETIPMQDDPMTDPTRLREAARHLVAAWPNLVHHPRMHGSEIDALRAALATPDPAPLTSTDQLEAEQRGLPTPFPDPAPDKLLDAIRAYGDARADVAYGRATRKAIDLAWDTVLTVAHIPPMDARVALATPDPAPDVETEENRCSPYYERGWKAGRAQGGRLDVETLARAMCGSLDPKPDDITTMHVDDECRTRARRVAAEYARLRDTPQPEEENQ